MPVVIMVPPADPISNVFDGDLSTDGAMEDGGRSPENSKKGNSPKSPSKCPRKEIKVGMKVKFGD